jgi:transcriptional regulator with XRE-family HTH domain
MAERKRIFRGDRLRDARERHGLTQEDISERIGASKAQINRYENGKSDPTPDVLMRLATELDVPIDWLLGRSDTEPSSSSTQITPEEEALLRYARKGDVEGAMRLVLKMKRSSPPEGSESD